MQLNTQWMGKFVISRQICSYIDEYMKSRRLITKTKMNLSYEYDQFPLTESSKQDPADVNFLFSDQTLLRNDSCVSKGRNGTETE